MKIFDCCMYFDEEVILDVRLNTLDKFVDYFVIVESTFTHKGEKRSLKFKPKRFDKFKNKIIFSLIFFKFKFSSLGISSTSEINMRSSFSAIVSPCSIKFR